MTPFVALWFPFQVVRDVRRALSPMETSALIGFWWALFLASEIGVRTSLNLQGDALVRFENAASARQWSVITAAVMLAALAGWGQVLRADHRRAARADVPLVPQNITVENRAVSRKPTRS